MNLLAWFRNWMDTRANRPEIPAEPDQLYASIDNNVAVDDIRFWKQHVPEYCRTSGIGLRSPSFQDYLLDTSRGQIHARSMLTQSELALLYALARNHVRGDGHIVDLGPLIGVGSYCFARGLSQNRPAMGTSRIFSYDLFLMENMSHFLPASDAGATGSVFHKFLEINRDFLDIIVPVPGDLTKMSWNGDPIEVLFVDLAKTWQLNQHVLKKFFPSLIPGHSILVQQDYVHVGEPWIALTMEILGEYFEHLYSIYGATSVYRLLKPIPDHVLTQDMRALPQAAIEAHMENAKAKASPAIREVLKTCQAALRIEKGDIDGAARMIGTVDVRVRDGKDESQEFNPAIRANLRAVTKWLEQARTNPHFTHG